MPNADNAIPPLGDPVAGGTGHAEWRDQLSSPGRVCPTALSSTGASSPPALQALALGQHPAAGTDGSRLQATGSGIHELGQALSGSRRGSNTQRWFAIDGKGLNGSLTDPCEAHQQFVNLVSVFSHAQGIVVAMEQYRSNQGSEITVVEALIAALDLPAVTYTMDAAHAQKKR